MFNPKPKSVPKIRSRFAGFVASISMIFCLLATGLPASVAKVLPQHTQPPWATTDRAKTQQFTVATTVTIPRLHIDQPAATSMKTWQNWHAARLQAKAAAHAARIAHNAAIRQAKLLTAAANIPIGIKQRYALKTMATVYGLVDPAEQACLLNLWNRESGWSTTAANNTSGAYGIPQALPGSKMAVSGADWRTNYKTQITWGLGYIAHGAYGTPCNAWAHSQTTGWY